MTTTETELLECATSIRMALNTMGMAMIAEMDNLSEESQTIVATSLIHIRVANQLMLQLLPGRDDEATGARIEDLIGDLKTQLLPKDVAEGIKRGREKTHDDQA